MSKTFYEIVGDYYDYDAPDFDYRYWQNPTLQRIRQSFREQVKRYEFEKILEIGCGTGIDVLHFAKTQPNANIFAIDVSGQMCSISRQKLAEHGIENATVEKGTTEDIEHLFPNEKFDVVYVFFGALNTVDDLSLAAKNIEKCMKNGGVAVLTFVNKHYVAGVLIELMKLRFKAAFSRLKKQWGGYSPSKNLPSQCYTPKQIADAFSGLNRVYSKGYSILHPAWYYNRLNKLLGKRGRRVLWNIDSLISKTLFWRFGEYTLFVFKKPDNA
jgi:ubiquinone/menaquinone biosynthesis C-methylase UbiE